jgi:hypothetical protein
LFQSESAEEIFVDDDDNDVSVDDQSTHEYDIKLPDGM